MLIEMVTEVGCKVVSANTDGITVKVKKHLKTNFDEVCKNWSEITKMQLEFNEYELYARTAVNDYIAAKKGYKEDPTDKIKEKGLFITKPKLGKSAQHLIIPKALSAYFLYGTPIEDTIYGSTNIFDFTMSEKTGKQ
jgi:hypothetical protein